MILYGIMTLHGIVWDYNDIIMTLYEKGGSFWAENSNVLP